MKNNRRIYVSIGVILFAMTLIAVFAFRQEAQVNQQEQDDPPTPIQLGVMSEKQRKNSRKFNSKKKYKLPNEARDRDIGVIIGRPFINPEPPAGGVLPSQDAFLQKRICDSQIILTGRVNSKSSQLSELLDTVFTDYELAVNGIFKNNSGLNIVPPTTITVSRSGGVVRLNGRIIKVINKSYQVLKVGKEYLLFLNYLGDSDTFVPSSSEGTFEIQGNKISRLKDKNIPYRGINEDFNAFIDSVNKSVQGCLN